MQENLCLNIMKSVLWRSVLSLSQNTPEGKLPLQNLQSGSVSMRMATTCHLANLSKIQYAFHSCSRSRCGCRDRRCRLPCGGFDKCHISWCVVANSVRRISLFAHLATLQLYCVIFHDYCTAQGSKIHLAPPLRVRQNGIGLSYPLQTLHAVATARRATAHPGAFNSRIVLRSAFSHGRIMKAL